MLVQKLTISFNTQVSMATHVSLTSVVATYMQQITGRLFTLNPKPIMHIADCGLCQQGLAIMSLSMMQQRQKVLTPAYLC